MIYFCSLLVCISITLDQEKASGIFITADNPRKIRCENELKMLIGKNRVCISKKPIIQIKELRYITDIQYNPKSQTYYVDVGLSSSGMQTLNRIISSLPNSKFALVVDDEIICIFRITTETDIRAIRVGEDAALNDLKIIHAALKKIDL